MADQRVLVAYGSRMGGTAGLAGMLGEALRQRGLEVDVAPAREVRDLSPYRAVVVGGALYAFRWHRDARRFLRRHRRLLATKDLWLFSSGPLDDSAVERDLPPVRFVARAMRSLGAHGHVTFGGAMPADASGFPASVMAKEHAGDWRDPAHVERVAASIAGRLAGTGPAARA